MQLRESWMFFIQNDKLIQWLPDITEYGKASIQMGNSTLWIWLVVLQYVVVKFIFYFYLPLLTQALMHLLTCFLPHLLRVDCIDKLQIKDYTSLDTLCTLEIKVWNICSCKHVYGYNSVHTYFFQQTLSNNTVKGHWEAGRKKDKAYVSYCAKRPLYCRDS